MFTGIVQDLGVVESIEEAGSSKVFSFCTKLNDKDLSKGNSISVNGVCLTVESSEAGKFSVTAVEETLSLTNLSALSPGSSVNFEAALTLQTPLAGHFVSGHVDQQAKVMEVGPRMRIQIPQEFVKFTPKKGSITLNGVSLTIADVQDNELSFALIPETLSMTNLQFLQVGDFVNFEIDLLARYLFQIQNS